ncbi:MAG: PTS sugar transporter subunit IIA [Zymomonas mobilis subsp. pomaceae]|uniref:Putative PTS IIA-like nitrogen-regulatory protein PtsN n=1 Tax=Zymomonas mobilis subsp. pomaceae (strain ATCC 29192 / DSM 22645 / JCM 10191 / CCUG 17912 / NBRC 13757 / NCIMB 11200 / NRRL B-4491 / Barker I) TaxID=579138 RepID=F8ETV3_ZYMMT|nr:PTS sugar transporter subunit IIA [Zymomonas mobilis]AEI38050.1 putative PTS IIA-like nitrogen-regulatory protein PtsN [Zymomonas mobilis subsp. pomaceae ATCC 29192]MDX5949416.1 PTS sugar transporter subunit IIA [Zymomonas mobilis subsp. pomaceae]GEB89159.1 PTS lactose transporter subunit IIC [Zymomonas mobilis subsp. pomaceae]
MNKLAEIIGPDRIETAFNPSNKKSLFQQVGQWAGQKFLINPKQIVERLHEREHLGSTGFGHGIAIPHGKLDGLKHVSGFFVRLKEPIEFDAVDKLPVDLLFFLFSPTDAGIDHLRSLACVSRRLRDGDLRAKLRGASSGDALYALLIDENETK